jgi:hypothetical protein
VFFDLSEGKVFAVAKLSASNVGETVPLQSLSERMLVPHPQMRRIAEGRTQEAGYASRAGNMT